MAKILWHSNAPWACTGYGTQTKIFASRLQHTLGHEMTISAYYGLQGGSLQNDGIMILPNYADPYGNDMLRAHTQFLESDLVITLCDVWIFDEKKMKTIPWTPWLPVDHWPVPRPVVNVLTKGKATPIAMSRYGQQKLREAGFDPVFYVPHSPDPVFYDPIPKEDAKAKFGWEDKFVVTMVAANKGYPCRKSFPQAIEAFYQFAQGKDDVLLYLHTEPRTPWGVRLDLMLEDMGFSAEDERVRFVDPYRYIIGMFPDYLRDAYCASDVLLNPSMGEGFGIPIIEAQACGTPVIVTDATAMSELCHFGAKVGGRPFYTAQQAWQMLPDVDLIVGALQQSYDADPEQVKDASEETKEWAKNYHPDVVTEMLWKPAIEELVSIQEKRTDLDLDSLDVITDIEDFKENMDE